MPTIKLTKRAVDDAEPERGAEGQIRTTIYFDRDVKGFGLLVTQHGSKSFVVKYRAGSGRSAPTRRVTIGRYGSPWTVEQARSEAKRILGEVARGSDPAAQRAAKRRGVDDDRTVAAITERWLQRDQSDNRTVDEVRRIMAREVLPWLGKLPMAEVRKRDIIEVIDRVAERAPVRANRVLAHTKRLFRWAASRDLIETDPAVHIEKPSPENRRDRVLTEVELVEVWRALEGMTPPFLAGVRLLMLTAARKSEIFEAIWPELVDGALALPAERAKAKEGRMIPLSPAALGIIEALPRFAGSRWLLTMDGRHPYANSGHAKVLLDQRILHARRVLNPGSAAPMPPWRLHDLRRTVATGLQKLGVRLEVIEAVLGHVSGSRAGIVGVYQCHRFDSEAREALIAWGDHLQRLIDGNSKDAEGVPVRRA
jgi:integrase